MFLPLFLPQKCLDKDPTKRWSSEQLLNHSFFETHNFIKPDYEEYNNMRQGRVRDRGGARVSVTHARHTEHKKRTNITRMNSHS